MTLAGRMFGLIRNPSRGSTGVSGYDHERNVDPVGLVAVTAAVRLVSETLGSFVMRVYEGDMEKRQPILDAPQAAVLQDAAPGYCTSMNLWSDVATNVELYGNALIWKGKDSVGTVRELYPFPVQAVSIYVNEDGDKVIEARIAGELKDITADVIHVRGWSAIAGVSGIQTTRLHRRTIRGAIALEEFRGRYFDNDSTPSLIVNMPGNPDSDQRGEFRESWHARHAGPNGDHMAITWGGITVSQLAANLQESQVAELMKMDDLGVARMLQIYPTGLLVSDPMAPAPLAENTSDLFQRFTLLKRQRNIERAVSADRDLFPDRKRYSRFDTNEFTRGSVATASTKVHALKQVGMITANEGRAELGYPPSSDPKADELLVTPVGAAPNPAGASNPSTGESK